MPELPDLTVYAENLTKILKGKKVKSVELFKPQNSDADFNKLKESIIDQTIQGVNRVGKEIEFVFSNKTKLQVHLMLTGKFHINKNIQNINFKILSLFFSEGETLTISDPKGFANLKLNPTPSDVPDALDLDESYLTETIQEKRRTNVKSFLLDQKIIRGIGNAYADEILWHAKISPKSVLGKLPEKVIIDFNNSIKVVLLDAIEKIKHSDPNILSGEIRGFLAVHNYKRNETPTGHKIIRERISSKDTFYTDEQILYV